MFIMKQWDASAIVSKAHRQRQDAATGLIGPLPILALPNTEMVTPSWNCQNGRALLFLALLPSYLARIFHGMPLYELVKADFGVRRSGLACFDAIV
jgi:hypothetical protein